MGEKFCLKWNDFEHNVSSAFNDIREEKDFFDVTLVCDNNQVQAHKVIIAACSPFFKSILRRNPHQHPLLYLKGVLYEDIVSVLHFMYKGEVNIAQEQLNSFLAVAEDLQVKGLTQDGNSSQAKPKTETIKPSSSNSYKPAPQIKKPSVSRISPGIAASSSSHQQPGGYVDAGVDDDIQEVLPVKTEPSSSHRLESVHDQSGIVAQMEDENYVEEGYEYADGQYDAAAYGTMGDGTDIAKGDEVFANLDDLINSSIISSTGMYTCSICGYSNMYKTNLRTHIETNHVDGSQKQSPCSLCAYVGPSKSA